MTAKPKRIQKNCEGLNRPAAATPERRAVKKLKSKIPVFARRYQNFISRNPFLQDLKYRATNTDVFKLTLLSVGNFTLSCASTMFAQLVLPSRISL